MAKVVFQKRTPTDTTGYLFIRHIQAGKRKLISLDTKLSESHFKEFFVPKQQQFRPTSIIDYRTINTIIDKHINDNVFDIVLPVAVESFLTFFESQIAHIFNPSSRTDYAQNHVKLTAYLTEINRLDITFEEIDTTFLVKYKKWLIDIKGNNPNTVSHHMTILRSMLNIASDDKSIPFVLDRRTFKKMISSTTPAKKQLPKMNDIKKLMSLSPTDKYYFESNMFLLGISLGGLRFNDLLFIRYSDFQDNHIRLIASKTKKPLSIPHNSQIIRVLAKILLVPSTNDITYHHIHHPNFVKTVTPIEDYRDFQKYDSKSQQEQLKKTVLSLIRSQKQSDFLFKDFIDTGIFDSYTKMIHMTDEQHQKYGIKRTRYNEILSKICEVHQLSITKMSSHFSRYVAVMILLENGMDFLKISKILQHAKIQQTIDYIKNNYDEAYLSEMTEMMDKSF